MTEENVVVGRFSRGGEGMTSSAPGGLATALALTFARRAHMIKDAPGKLHGTAHVVVDLPWPSDGSPLPVDPSLGNKILKELGPHHPQPAVRVARTGSAPPTGKLRHRSRAGHRTHHRSSARQECGGRHGGFRARPPLPPGKEFCSTCSRVGWAVAQPAGHDTVIHRA
jgi:hypothetical protein